MYIIYTVTGEHLSNFFFGDNGPHMKFSFILIGISAELLFIPTPLSAHINHMETKHILKTKTLCFSVINIVVAYSFSFTLSLHTPLKKV